MEVLLIEGENLGWKGEGSNILYLLSRPTIPIHASHPTSASSCSSACAILHNDTSTLSPYDGKVVVCITDLSVGKSQL